MDKYNQQQLSEKLIAEQVSPDPSQENATPMLERVINSVGEDALKGRRINRKQSFPTWMMFLLVSIFGVVMALPLLQL